MSLIQRNWIYYYHGVKNYLKLRYPHENQISTNLGFIFFGSLFSYFAILSVSNDPIEFTYLEKACGDLMIGTLGFLFGGTIGAIIGFYTKFFGVFTLPILLHFFLKNKLIFTFGQIS